MEEKADVKSLIIIILLIMITALLFIVIQNKETTKPQEEQKKEEKNTEEIAKGLYNKIIKFKYIGGGYLFINMGESEKLKAAYENVDSLNKVDYDYDRCMETYYDRSKEKDRKDLCTVHYVTKDDFEKSYKDLFGSNSNIIYDDFDALGLNSCYLDDNKVKCYLLLGGIESGINQYSKLEKYEEIDDYIYLYINTLLKDMMDTKIIGKNNKEIDDDTYYKSLLKNYEISEENINKLFARYQGQTMDFKLTFKKDVNNNYYFVKTEEIK